MKNLRYILIPVLILTSINLFGQTDKATTVKVIEAKNFIFNATAAMPMGNTDLNRVLGRLNNLNGSSSGSINLTGSSYDLSVTPDSVVAYLPYYGRSYTAPMNPDESGTKFKSKDFSYKTEKRKKGGWIITIVPKDIKDRQTFTLNISENGYAQLYVNNNNRQPISFNGYISEPKEAKK